MTSDINCEADVKHLKKDKKDFVTFTKENFRDSVRQVTGRNSEILYFKDMLLKLMLQGKFNRKLIFEKKFL